MSQADSGQCAARPEMLRIKRHNLQLIILELIILSGLLLIIIN